MQTSVTFKNLDSSEHLRTYVSEKLNKFDRLLDNPAEANVVLSVEKFRHIAEISITGDRLIIKGKEETIDMYSAIDMVLDKIETQIKKHKEKSRDRRTGLKTRAKVIPLQELQQSSFRQTGRVLIQNIEYKPMDVEEAIMQIDLVPDNFLVFMNARTDQVNVLYRRKDGDYGLIQPSS